MPYKCGYNIIDEKLLMAIGEGATEAEAKRATDKDMLNEIKKAIDEALDTPCPEKCREQEFRGGIEPNPWKTKCTEHKGVWACIAATNFLRIILCWDPEIKIGRHREDAGITPTEKEVEQYFKKLKITYEE